MIDGKSRHGNRAWARLGPINTSASHAPRAGIVARGASPGMRPTDPNFLTRDGERNARSLAGSLASIDRARNSAVCEIHDEARLQPPPLRVAKASAGKLNPSRRLEPQMEIGPSFVRIASKSARKDVANRSDWWSLQNVIRAIKITLLRATCARARHVSTLEFPVCDKSFSFRAFPPPSLSPPFEQVR